MPGNRKPSIDWSGIADAVRSPGIDTRSWIALARIDNDPDAIRWDDKLGWIVDVTVHGGPLDQEGPIACRVANALSTAGSVASCPVHRNDEVLVELPVGDPNAGPVIVGRLNNKELPVPGEVNGYTLDEAFALANLVLRTMHGLQVQLDGDAQVQAANWQLMGGKIYWGGAPNEQPTEPVIKGQAYTDALNDWEAAVGAFAQSVTTWSTAVASALGSLGAPVPNVDVVTNAAKLQAATQQFSAAATQALSRKVFTE